MIWKSELRAATMSAKQLLDVASLTEDDIAIDQSPGFKIFVPPRWCSRIEKKNVNDPLLLQVLSQSYELVDHSQSSKDPLDEVEYTVTGGMLHKYPHRILVIASGACPIHCRYCFRRHFPYDTHALNENSWGSIVSYIRSRDDIYEVILSGGDPLMLSDNRLSRMFEDLLKLPTIKRIRLHTRFATTIPSRFTDDFWLMLEPFSHRIIWVWHVNHANELGEDVRCIVRKSMSMGMRVLSQSVLLKGVNSTVSSMSELLWALDETGIQPYYVHQLDRVSGANHFEVSVADGLALMEEIQMSMPGYLVPKYVKEIPGMKSKTILTKDFVDILG